MLHTIVTSKSYYPKDETIRFTKYEHQLPCPFIIVADIESILEPISTVSPNPILSHTTAYQNHVPCSAAYFIISIDKNFYQPPKLFKGPHCILQFLNHLSEDVAGLKEDIKHPLAMTITKEEQLSVVRATKCHICGKGNEVAKCYVADHCHLT